jgi:hypothetical protein
MLHAGMPAVFKAYNSAGLRPFKKLLIFLQGQGCRARLPGKAAGQGCMRQRLEERLESLTQNMPIPTDLTYA